MEPQVQQLVEKAWKRYQDTPKDQRLVIGIAGIPGSGKTTLAKIITRELNKHALDLSPDMPPPAAFLPMDGFHLTRAALSAMPDPATAHARRGAAFTFDGVKFIQLVRALRLPPTGPILAPSFDHAVKDPKEGDIEILPEHRIVVIEGLYLTLGKDPWKYATRLFDEVWFVEVDFEVARKRLAERHVRAGIAATLEEGYKRAQENDLVNGEEILSHRLRVDELVQSREDATWVHE